MILDVGCGNNPFGDVNVDLFVEPTAHRGDRRGWHEGKIEIRKTPNFVKATVYALPFLANTFDLVYSENTIEHVYDPYRMLKEIARVTKHKVIIICPHRYYAKLSSKMHISFLNLTWFEKAFRKLGFIGIKCHYSKMVKLPHPLLGITNFPEEITVEATKPNFDLFEEKHDSYLLEWLIIQKGSDYY